MKDIDLQEGVLPISAAASQLARRIKQAKATKQPIIVTQKGYPAGVIIDIETFEALRALAQSMQSGAEGEGPATS